MSDKRIKFKRSEQIESLELQIGGRLFAFVLDLIFIKLLLAVVAFLFSLAAIGWEAKAIMPFNQFNLLTLPFYWLYFAFLEYIFGGTVGKLFTRYRISNVDGSRISLSKATARFPLKLIAITTLLGVLMIDVNRKKQGLHDLICGTIVRRI